MGASIFIDGEAGTTGLQIRERLAGHGGLEMVRLDESARKDPVKRRDALNACDLAILCLPDDAAREAVAMLDPSSGTRVIDASTAHRTATDWVYGMPEWPSGHADIIRRATRVSNPGCYANASISILAPLVAAGLVPVDWPVTINAVSGYSGGGKRMIASFEDPDAEHRTDENFRVYGLNLVHKHVPEIQLRSGLLTRPLFVPSVGRFRQGMIVQVPLQLWSLPGTPTLKAVHEILDAHYAGCRFVHVVPLDETRLMTGLEPEAVNGTNNLRLHVFGHDDAGQAVVMGVLDNLGKGASGLAVQNLNLMLGIDEATGL